MRRNLSSFFTAYSMSLPCGMSTKGTPVAAHALGDDRHQHQVVGVDDADPELLDDARHGRDVPLEVGLERLVREVDHRYDVRELLVAVPHEDRERVADLRLVKDAAPRVGRVALEQRLDCAVGPVAVGRGDEGVVGRVASWQTRCTSSSSRQSDSTIDRVQRLLPEPSSR